MSVDMVMADTYIGSPMDSADPIFGAPSKTGNRRAGTERTVLGRVATIMDAFNGTQRILSLGDLSQHTGLPKSTLHRLADQLCQVGWIRKVPGGYRIGMRMFELGSLALEAERIQEVAYPHLRALAARTAMYVHLSIPEGAEVIHLDRVASGPLRLTTRRGERAPAYCTALGKAIAAFDDDIADAILNAPMPRRNAHTIFEPGAFLNELQRVRNSGIAVDRGGYHEGLICIAAPIRQSHNVIGAVSVTGTAGKIRGEAASAAVRSTAESIVNAISIKSRKLHSY